MPPDKCGENIAKELKNMIDIILEEHTSTLQNVIDNIKRSQPNLGRPHLASVDLVEQRQLVKEPTYTPTFWTPNNGDSQAVKPLKVSHFGKL
jgi:hypothetical protein